VKGYGLVVFVVHVYRRTDWGTASQRVTGSHTCGEIKHYHGSISWEPIVDMNNIDEVSHERCKTESETGVQSERVGGLGAEMDNEQAMTSATC
jgi:hypothetical protein